MCNLKYVNRIYNVYDILLLLITEETFVTR